jgi:hypothetical protein
MKLTTTLTLLLLVGSPLLAQQPVITLSASTFYRGDAPGSYTVTCPANTSAAISVMTKISDVPLLNPASTQYSIGAVFPWPSVSNNPLPTLTGTLPQSSTTTVMGGTVIYNAGVLVCNAYCNTGSFINTTTKSFTLSLGGMTREEEAIYKTQKTYALRANSVTLPRLTTADQTTLPPQQAGNVVYNTDQQKMAVHNGSGWQYIAPAEASQFKNEVGIFNWIESPVTWTVPAGVTRIFAEVWGGGAGGAFYVNNSGALTATGGGAGGYGRGYMTVTPGSNLTLTIGRFGSGGKSSTNLYPTDGKNSKISNGTDYIEATGGTAHGLGGYVPASSILGYRCDGGNGAEVSISYGQKSASEYILLVKCGDGGLAYGSQPGGFGSQFASLNSASLLYKTDNFDTQAASGAGSGGGAGYSSGGDGRAGMVILHW